MNRTKEIQERLRQLEARQHQERQDLITLEKYKTFALERYPLEKGRFHPFSVHTDIAVDIEQDSLRSALIFLSTFELDLLPIIEVKDSCTSLKPAYKIEPLEQQGVWRPVGDLLMRVDGLRQYGDEQSLVCYVPIEGTQIKPLRSARITVKILEPWHKIRRDWSERHYKGDTCVKDCVLIQETKLFHEKITWWSSSEQPNKYTLTKALGKPSDLLEELGASVVKTERAVS